MSTPDDSHFDPDDPRLTAYALGELPDPADRAHVESLLAASPEARAELADIRALTTALAAEYDHDRLAADPVPTPDNIIRLPTPRRAWSHPWLSAAAVWLIAGALAALLLPVASHLLVKGSRQNGQVANWLNETSVGANDQQERALAVPAPEPAQPAATRSTGQLAAAAPGTRDPAFPLLAAAAPAVDMAGNKSLAINGKDVFTSSTNASGGAVSPGSGTSLADSLKSAGAPAELPLADAVIVTGSNIPTSEEVAPASVDKPRSAISGSNRLALRASKTAPAGTSETFFKKDRLADAARWPQTFADSSRQSQGSASGEDVLSTFTTASPPVASGGGSVHVDPNADIDLVSRRVRVDQPFNTAAYDHITETPFLTTQENPLSTFSVDVDTASYSIVRRFIEGGSLPPAGAVRIEEMLNYFPYSYAPPAPGDERPFAIHLEGAACPWNPDHRLVRVALQGREMAPDKRPPSNLVFLIDVSGSMEPSERLPLIKQSLRLLVERLTDNDRVAIVVYAGNSGLVLPSTNGTHKDTILAALDRLEAGGSTNGASGITLAYKVAQENFLQGGTNRVILATDGDFNVGTTSQGELVRLIEKEARSGVFLTCLGVGTDNLKDSTMQKLADHGNGNYAYLDGIAEAKKVLVEQMSGTLVTIAKDVKIQVEFNPATVNSYRLIGYEKRLLRKEDFNDDRVDAGEIGAGHSVTALYEIVPAGQRDPAAVPSVDPLKYGPLSVGASTATPGAPAPSHELLTVKIRHKAPDSETSERSYEAAFVDPGTVADYAHATPDFKFAAAVATFGLVLRDSPYKGNATLGAAIELAQEGKGPDASGYRAGFIELARRARSLQGRDGSPKRP